jgi:hypothetical protein
MVALWEPGGNHDYELHRTCWVNGRWSGIDRLEMSQTHNIFLPRVLHQRLRRLQCILLQRSFLGRDRQFISELSIRFRESGATVKFLKSSGKHSSREPCGSVEFWVDKITRDNS